MKTLIKIVFYITLTYKTAFSQNFTYNRISIESDLLKKEFSQLPTYYKFSLLKDGKYELLSKKDTIKFIKDSNIMNGSINSNKYHSFNAIYKNNDYYILYFLDGKFLSISNRDTKQSITFSNEP